ASNNERRTTNDEPGTTHHERRTTNGGSRESAVRPRASEARWHDLTARRRAAGRDEPQQGLLAEREAHEGRSVPLLRESRAGDPAGARRSTAGHEALPQRCRGAAVLSAPGPGCAAWRAQRDRQRRRAAAADRRRIA